MILPTAPLHSCLPAHLHTEAGPTRLVVMLYLETRISRISMNISAIFFFLQIDLYGPQITQVLNVANNIEYFIWML